MCVSSASQETQVLNEQEYVCNMHDLVVVKLAFQQI